MSSTNAANPAEPTFLGHPRGLVFLTLTEAWERFSFYGMQTLLVLYMVGQLLQPGHAENVLGLAALRGGLESVFGPMTPQALSSLIFGLYTGFAYLTPVFGGLLGDRVLGQRRAVIMGAVLMAAGHFLMALEPSFLIALLLLILGAGLLKGNINAQVGRLYALDDRRRTDAFQIFQVSVNVGVISAPFVCGTLGELFGWHYGFAAAGVGMLLGLIIYVSGRRYLPVDVLKQVKASNAPTLQRKDWQVIGALLCVMVVIICYLTSVGQLGNIYLLWLKSDVDRSLFGFEVPVTWFLSFTAIGAILIAPLLLKLWQRQAKAGKEPSLLAKIAIGCAFAASAEAMLAVFALAHRGGWEIPWMLLLIYHLTVSVAFLFVWPVGLALFSQAAPLAMSTTFIGIYFVCGFFSSNLVGWIGSFYKVMDPLAFWIMNASIAAFGLAIVLVFGRPLGRLLAPRPIEAQ